MIVQGLTLTILGMVIVFLFLTILVVIMMVLSGIVRRMEKGKESIPAEAGSEGSANLIAEEMAAAVAAARAYARR